MIQKLNFFNIFGETTANPPGPSQAQASGTSVDTCAIDPNSISFDVEKSAAVGKECKTKSFQHGFFSFVYKGTYEGQSCAIKKFKEKAVKENIQIFSYLVKVDHENIVKFHGFLEDKSRPSFVMELCECTLYSYLDDLARKGEVTAAQTDVVQKLSILKDVCSAMVFLHDHSIPHGDLYARKVLLVGCQEKRIVAKVSDIQVFRYISKSFPNFKEKYNRWCAIMPPEISAAQGHYPENIEEACAADVFSFGCLSIHVATCKFPLPEAPSTGTHNSSGIEYSRRRKTINFIKGSNYEIFKVIIKQCLADTPADRGTFFSILQVLETDSKSKAFRSSEHQEQVTRNPSNERSSTFNVEREITSLKCEVDSLRASEDLQKTKDKLLERDEELEYLKRVHEDLKDLYRKTAAEKSATLQELEKQKKLAKEATKNRDGYKEACDKSKTALSKNEAEIRNLKGTIAQLERTLRSMKEEKNGLSTDLTSIKKDLQNEKKKNKTQSDTILEQKKKINSLERKLKDEKDVKKSANDKSILLEEQNRVLNQTVSTYDVNIADLKQSLELEEKRTRDLTTQLQDTEKQLKTITGEKENLDTTLSVTNAEKKRLAEEVNKLKPQLALRDRDLETMNEKVRILTNERNDAQKGEEQVPILQKELRELQKEVDECKEQLETRNHELEEERKKCKKLEVDNKRLSQENESTLAEKNKKESEMGSENKQLQRRLRMSETENRNLRESLSTASTQRDNARSEVDELKQLKDKKIEELSNLHGDHEKLRERENSSLIEKTKKIEALEEQVQNQKMRLSYTEDEKNTRSNELSSLKLEKERVEDELLSENKKLETELLSVTNKSDETTKQLLLRENEVQQLKEVKEDLIVKLKKWKEEAEKEKSTNAKLSNKVKKLELTLEIREEDMLKEKASMKEDMAELTQKRNLCDELNLELMSLQEELDTKESLLQESHRLEQDYESKIIELEHENEKQRKSSEQLERLVENTSIELETTQIHLEKMQQSEAKCKEELKRLYDDHDRLRLRENTALLEKTKELETQKSFFVQEKDNLMFRLQEKNEAIRNLEIKLEDATMELQVQQYEHGDAKQMAQEKIHALINEKEGLKKKVKKKEKDFQGKLEDLQFKKARFKCEKEHWEQEQGRANGTVLPARSFSHYLGRRVQYSQIERENKQLKSAMRRASVHEARMQREFKALQFKLFESHKYPPLLYIFQCHQKEPALHLDPIPSLTPTPVPTISTAQFLHDLDPNINPWSKEMADAVNVFKELLCFKPNALGHLSFSFLSFSAEQKVSVYRFHLALVPKVLTKCSNGGGHVSPQVLVIYAYCDLKEDAASELAKLLKPSQHGTLFYPSTFGIVPSLESTSNCSQGLPDLLKPLTDWLDNHTMHKLESQYTW